MQCGVWVLLWLLVEDREGERVSFMVECGCDGAVEREKEG